MVSVTCVIVCHLENPVPIIENMLNQTYKNKELLVLSSEINTKPLRKIYPECRFLNMVNRPTEWGHDKRERGLKLAKGKYVCFCNADDNYSPSFLEIMVDALQKSKADFAYCNFRERTIDGNVVIPVLEMGGVTGGCFVVKTDIAQKIGWKHRVYAADWYFIRDLLKEGIKLVYVPYTLMKHN